LEVALTEVDAIADRTFASWKVPGLSYGIVLDGGLRHARGLGTLRVGETAAPDADSVFRIASMTKSFTAATLLLLRDEGRLRLDDPLAAHLPELERIVGPTADSPSITIRHLMTMTAGFPTDDPWGDRQQGLDLEAFADLLAGGLSFAWAPGTRFEYSNLGYGILGRVITRVAGREYREAVRERLLEPLGMTSTGYLESEVPPERLAKGYLWRDNAFLEEPMDPYGALASMGGVFTTVRDLTRWVGGFTDAFPPRDDPNGTHPLSRASRREMQQPMVPLVPGVSFSSTDADPELDGGGYGFGLFIVDHLRWGRIVSHGGGYPGFGSNMRWHAPSGLGVVVLANGRYANAGLLAADLIHALLRADAAPSRRVRANDATTAARERVEALLRRWDDRAAADLFAMNVELDEPIERRRAAVERLAQVHGRLEADPSETPVSQSPFHLEWWLRGERGRVKVEIQLTPELPPRVQTFTVRSVPEPPKALADAAEQIVGAVAAADGGAPAWPDEVRLGPKVDQAKLARALRAAEARFGPIRLGKVVAGDGERTATFRVACARGSLDLALERDPGDGVLTSVALVPSTLEPPAYG